MVLHKRVGFIRRARILKPMTEDTKGEVRETYLSDLHSRRTEDKQSSFSDFTNSDVDDEIGSAIAVVTDPTGGIIEASDEFIPELGMPEKELNNFRAYRSSLDIEDSNRKHNVAVEETNLEESYRKHLRTDEEAIKKIDNLSERVANGEDITLVCFEKEPKWCHRHILVEKIESKVDNY
jgi:hypothetical protein